MIVPVLSNSSEFTSPAASTALPLIASTLCCITRSMPAIPMAESKPPMVVGIRQTSRETSTATRRHRARSRLRTLKTRIGLQRHYRQKEDQRQARDQDIQRDLVGRFLPFGAFHQRDHTVQERFAGVGGDSDLDVIRQYASFRR